MSLPKISSLRNATFAALLAPFVALTASTALAAGDMLTPDEVQHTGISENPANDSGLFLGAGVHFGQARTTEGGATPGLALLGDIEPGYQFNRGSWSRMEFSVELQSGSLGFRTDSWGKTDLSLGLGTLAKFGYGYSLGQKAIGMVKVGVGPAFAKLQSDVPTPNGSGTNSYNSGSLSGLGAMLGWEVVVPLNSLFDATAGVSWTYYQFDVSKLTGPSSEPVVGINHTVIVNVPAAELGLRLRL